MDIDIIKRIIWIINDLYYSFKIDGSKMDKEDMFYMPYHIKSNESIEFNNMRNGLSIGINEIAKKNGLSGEFILLRTW